MILPVAKLGTLLLKTMSKPIATRLKTEASRHPKFRQFISNLAQGNRFSGWLRQRELSIEVVDKVGGRAAMEYTRDGAHGAASGEGAESSSSIVRGEGIRQDMSHAKLKTICHQAAEKTWKSKCVAKWIRPRNMLLLNSRLEICPRPFKIWRTIQSWHLSFGNPWQNPIIGDYQNVVLLMNMKCMLGACPLKVLKNSRKYVLSQLEMSRKW